MKLVDLITPVLFFNQNTLGQNIQTMAKKANLFDHYSLVDSTRIISTWSIHQNRIGSPTTKITN